MEILGPLLVVLLVLVVLYRATSSNPLKRCGRCKGKGTIPSTVLSGRYRVCPRCTRKGEVRAWGGGSE